MKIRTEGGRTLTLSRRDFVAQGGEGTVYARQKTAFKVYADPSNVIPRSKVRELARIADPQVVAPQELIFDAAGGGAVGFTMPYIEAAHSLCELFPRTFQRARGVGAGDVLHLATAIADRVHSVHAAGGAVVDLHGMNFLVDRSLKHVFAIDVDSYQTPSHPATALLPAVRDPWAAAFGPDSDWFAYAIVTYQLWCGVHPYRGKHPSVKGLEERMKRGLSVLHPDVRVPRATDPPSRIPEPLRRWYEAVFERGSRRPPPRLGAAPAAIAARPAPRSRPRAQHVTITPVSRFGAPIVAAGAQLGSLVVRSGAHVHVDGKRQRGTLPRDGHVVLGPVSRKPLVATLVGDRVRITDLESGVASDVAGRAKALMEHEGRLFALGDDHLVEVGVREIGGAVVASTDILASVHRHATRMHPGVVFQNLLSSCYASLIRVVPGARRAQARQARLACLDGRDIVAACHRRGVLSVLVQDGGRFDRYRFRFAPDRDEHDVAIARDVPPQLPSFTVLPRGVCIGLDDDGQLQVFPSRPGSAASRRIDDPAIAPDITLLADGDRVLFHHGEGLFHLSTR